MQQQKVMQLMAYVKKMPYAGIATDPHKIHARVEFTLLPMDAVPHVLEDRRKGRDADPRANQNHGWKLGGTVEHVLCRCCIGPAHVQAREHVVVMRWIV